MGGKGELKGVKGQMISIEQLNNNPYHRINVSTYQRILVKPVS